MPSVPESLSAMEIKYQDDIHKYWIDGIEVPSVTTILGATTPKDALTWWGMRIGMAGVVEALRRSLVTAVELAQANTWDEIRTGVPEEGSEFYVLREDKKKGTKFLDKRKPKTLAEKLILELKLSTNHVKEEGGTKGTAAHLVVESLGNGVVPNVKEIPEEHRGWVSGSINWWLDVEPIFVAQELIVGSRVHGYAGRFDWLQQSLISEDELPLDKRAQLAEARKTRPGVMPVELWDLKTSKEVYLSHVEQEGGYLEAYEEMELWRDYGPIVGGGVVHARQDGTYSAVPVTLTQLNQARRVFVAKVRQYDEATTLRGMISKELVK